MSFRFKEMKDLVFTKFLGDVQQYGEYSHCRGQAVRRFHRLMARVHKEHVKEGLGEDPQYTIIAHSLGTVMSMDSLLYASATRDVREGITPVEPNYPLKGYLTADEEEMFELRKKRNEEGENFSEEDKKRLKDLEEKSGELLEPQLDAEWIKHVKSFVTLGSPIDKYLVMWWMNYKYLLSPGNWLEPNEDKIKHYNYSDEQDPVGGELDVAQSAPGFRSVFDTQEDRVFTRYVVPGAAHNEYWKDLDLFKWILHRAVDQGEQEPSSKPTGETTEQKQTPELQMGASSQQSSNPPGGGSQQASSEEPPSNPPPKEPEWFVGKVYNKVLRITYAWIPLAVIFLVYFSFTWVMKEDNSIHSKAIALSVFIGAIWFGKRLMEFTVLWRQVLRAKSNETWEKLKVSSKRTKQIIKDIQKREKAKRSFKIFSWVWLIGNILLSGMVWAFYAKFFVGKFPQEQFIKVVFASIAAFVFYAMVIKFKSPVDSLNEGWAFLKKRWSENKEKLSGKEKRKELLKGILSPDIGGLGYSIIGTLLVTLALGILFGFFQMNGPHFIPEFLFSWILDLKEKDKFAFNLASLFTIASYILGYRMAKLKYVKSRMESWDMSGVKFDQYGKNP